LNTRMPTGNDVTQHRDSKPTFSHDLFEQIYGGIIYSPHENAFELIKEPRALMA